MDLRIPNQIVLSFIKQEAGRLCFNQLIAALGNWHPAGELVSSENTSQRPARGATGSSIPHFSLLPPIPQLLFLSLFFSFLFFFFFSSPFVSSFGKNFSGQNFVCTSSSRRQSFPSCKWVQPCAAGLFSSGCDANHHSPSKTQIVNGYYTWKRSFPLNEPSVITFWPY